MTDELMDGYPDIYDQLVDMDTLELRDRCRRAERALVAVTAGQALYGHERWTQDAIAQAREAQGDGPTPNV